MGAFSRNNEFQDLLTVQMFPLFLFKRRHQYSAAVWKNKLHNRAARKVCLKRGRSLWGSHASRQALMDEKHEIPADLPELSRGRAVDAGLNERKRRRVKV